MNKEDLKRLEEIKKFIAFLVLSPDHLMRKEDELDTIINHVRWLIRQLDTYRKVADAADDMYLEEIHLGHEGNSEPESFCRECKDVDKLKAALEEAGYE